MTDHTNNPRKEIEELFHVKESSSQIPLTKPDPVKLQIAQTIEASKILWGQESHELLSDFIYGMSLGKYGDDTQKLHIFFKRLGEALKSIITYICNKDNISSESFKLHFIMLNSILMLIADKLQDVKTEKHYLDTLATLNGFLISYIDEIVGQKQKRKKEKLSEENR